MNVISSGLGCVAPLGTKIFPAPYATVIKRREGGEIFSTILEDRRILKLLYLQFFKMFLLH